MGVRYDFICDDCGKELIDFTIGMTEPNPACPEISCNGKPMRKKIPTGVGFTPSPGMYCAN